MISVGRWARRFRALPDVIVRRAVAAWNRTVMRSRREEPPDPHEPAGLREVRARPRARSTDISRHLPTLYLEAVAASPRLIVEDRVEVPAPLRTAKAAANALLGATPTGGGLVAWARREGTP